MMVSAVVLGAGVLMMMCEATRPGRSWPQVAGWWLRAALLNGIEAGSVFVAGVAWDRWFLAHRLWSADALGHVGGALIGYLVITFIYYWWHRWRHQSAFLWRWVHQMHHSAQRIEIITSFYKHPLEIAANSVISSAIVYLIVGLNPEVAASVILLTGLAELFYHWNVRTPFWLGYFFQRPESHCVHHQEGLHASNYGDLPLWDMLFGTFHNPRDWNARCGLGSSNEHRFATMLLGRDVIKSPASEKAA